MVVVAAACVCRERRAVGGEAKPGATLIPPRFPLSWERRERALYMPPCAVPSLLDTTTSFPFLNSAGGAVPSHRSVVNATRSDIRACPF